MSMQTKGSCRKAFTGTLDALAYEHPDINAVTTDARGSVTLEQFAQNHPDQFVEMGIAEQDAVSVSAGMALTGKNVFVCGPACFLTTRSLEQVKVDVAYNKTNVKVVGVSGGLSYGPLGATHTTVTDIAQIRCIFNMTVLLPADAAQTEALTRQLAQFHGPVYMRMGRGDVYDVYEKGEEFTIGKAKQLRDGSDLTIIACGEMVWYAVRAAEKLAQEGVQARVLDMFTVKPIDREAILKAAQETGRILTVEEHSVYGGLGGAVAEILCQEKPVPLKIMGLPDEDIILGNSTELFTYYGIDAEGIRKGALELLKR